MNIEDEEEMTPEKQEAWATAAELTRLRSRVAVLEKVVEAAKAGPCRHNNDYDGKFCPLCNALDALKEG